MFDAAHIANAAMRVRIERACREADYEPPVIYWTRLPVRLYSPCAAHRLRAPLTG